VHTHPTRRTPATGPTLRAPYEAVDIGDDGRGFDLAEARGRGGLGLISLDERVLVRGRLTIDTQAQGGTEIHVVVPLP